MRTSPAVLQIIAFALFGALMVQTGFDFPPLPAAGTIPASIMAHGLTDTVGASWIDARLRAAEEHAIRA